VSVGAHQEAPSSLDADPSLLGWFGWRKTRNMTS